MTPCSINTLKLVLLKINEEIFKIQQVYLLYKISLNVRNCIREQNSDHLCYLALLFFVFLNILKIFRSENKYHLQVKMVRKENDELLGERIVRGALRGIGAIFRRSRTWRRRFGLRRTAASPLTALQQRSPI